MPRSRLLSLYHPAVGKIHRQRRLSRRSSHGDGRRSFAAANNEKGPSFARDQLEIAISIVISMAIAIRDRSPSYATVATSLLPSSLNSTCWSGTSPVGVYRERRRGARNG
ncbi:hypothetical protein TIFTF001_002993 [Ficus carica]|uniref:Uncharacterized protein n=1 Tax=Ficus carica TaxID=3494 RepID=A0AA87ZQG8_FICCA|nr:hypothetical protein TIFTF001_002993 [Ficus carica]